MKETNSYLYTLNLLEATLNRIIEVFQYSTDLEKNGADTKQILLDSGLLK